MRPSPEVLGREQGGGGGGWGGGGEGGGVSVWRTVVGGGGGGGGVVLVLLVRTIIKSVWGALIKLLWDSLNDARRGLQGVDQNFGLGESRTVDYDEGSYLT